MEDGKSGKGTGITQADGKKGWGAGGSQELEPVRAAVGRKIERQT